MDKIAIKGHPNNGGKIIKYFMSLGATNDLKRNGQSNWYYYITPYLNRIDCEPSGKLQEYKLYESWEEFEKTILNNNNMEERNVTISLEKAREWYKQGGDLKQVALQAFSEKELKERFFPINWNAYNMKMCQDDHRIDAGSMLGSADYCHFETEEEAKAFVALGKLIQLRDAYWMADNDWKPNWSCHTDVPSQGKYLIYVDAGHVVKGFGYCLGHILTFSTPKLRDEFYTNFKDLIEEAKMFL